MSVCLCVICKGGGLSATRFGLPLTGRQLKEPTNHFAHGLTLVCLSTLCLSIEHDTVESILNELDTNKDGSIQVCV